MSFEILHFRGSDKILEEKNMSRDVRYTMEYLDSALYGTYHRREILRQALDDMDWRTNGDLNILEGRRYFYKGFKKRVAIDGNFSSYEFILDGLLRLQIGFDKGKLDMGILLLTAQRSEKSPYGSTKNLVELEVLYLEPTITLPVTVVLFDLGKPGSAYEEKSNEADSKTSGSPENMENEVPDPAVIPVGNVPPVNVEGPSTEEEERTQEESHQRPDPRERPSQLKIQDHFRIVPGTKPPGDNFIMPNKIEQEGEHPCLRRRYWRSWTTMKIR